MSSDLITYERDGAVAIIGLNRPKKRNAINNDVVTQLRDAVLRAGDEADAGVIFGHGVNFSAGLDLAELLKNVDTPGTLYSTSSRAARFHLSPRCTARWSAAASSSRPPHISGSPIARRFSGCRKANAVFSSAAVVRSVFSASSVIL